MISDRASKVPFPAEYRASGLLMHVTSLPSRYGIGDVGPGALSWIDRIADAGQSWWQILPLGPTGADNSPYESASTFAGNAALVSPDWLVQDELLRQSDCEAHSFPEDNVDYGAVIPFKRGLLLKAWSNFSSGTRADLRTEYEQFRTEQADWLEDYALFEALKEKFGGARYLEWPAEMVRRQAAALESARRELSSQIEQVCFAQFLFFRQTDRLKSYARSKGISLLGDLPFYVSSDSSDVWANPELFLLDEQLRPRVVGGVPPDYFSADGQLWGNPVYNWDSLARSGYRWWSARLQSVLAHIDVIRLDHFRAFAAAWHVPAGARTAQTGEWVAGPGADFFRAVQKTLGSLPFIAEDLGLITPDVGALREEFHLPGMRVLQFAFDSKSDNPNLPANFDENTVVYTGTHDNSTTRAWFEDLPDSEQQKLYGSLNLPAGQTGDASRAMIHLAWTSRAALSIVPLQDLLNLGREARMNVPGRADANWSWRCREDLLSDQPFAWLRDLTKLSNRWGSSKLSNGGEQFEVASSI